MDEERPYAKRFRGENAAEDRINVSPSPVIHLRQLPPNTADGEILEAMQQFGPVSYVVNILPKRMALVEFEDMESSKRCLEYSNSSPVMVGGGTALVNYSTSKSLNRKGPGRPEAPQAPHYVLILFVKGVRYPVNVEVIHTICKPYGFVKRIAIIQRTDIIQVLVEFDSIEAARNAKNALDGADIYPGCNTIKAEYSRNSTVNVHVNDDQQWDFTVPTDNFMQSGPPPQEMNRSLLSGPPPSLGGGGMGPGMRNPAPMGMGGPPGSYGGGMPPGGPENGYGGYGQQSYGNPQPPPPPSGGGWGAPPGMDPGRQMGGPPGPDYGAGMMGGGGGQAAIMPAPYTDYRQDTGYGYPSGGSQFSGNIPVMLYGTDHENWSPQRVFNLLCLYGTIGKVQFLKGKPDTVMVEMGSVDQMNRAASCLNGADVFLGPLTIRRSRKDSISAPREVFQLPNGDDGFRDFSSDTRNQRFLTPEAAAKNQVMAPTNALHFYNAPANITEEELKTLLTDNGADEPETVTIMRSDRSSRGFLKFGDPRSATEALIKVNHVSIPATSGRFPYTFKVAFTQPARRA